MLKIVSFAENILVKDTIRLFVVKGVLFGLKLNANLISGLKSNHLISRKAGIMQKTFKIEWPDEYGPEWMNTDNLMICLFSQDHIGHPARGEVEVTEMKHLHEMLTADNR